MTPEKYEALRQFFESQVQAMHQALGNCSPEDLKKLQGKLEAYDHGLKFVKQEEKDFYQDDLEWEL